MPKDNEVDEKVRPVAWIVTNGGESCEPWLEYEPSEVDALPAVCITEPLYSAATVAELRAEVADLKARLVKQRRELGAETLCGLKDLMMRQVKWKPCDCGCPQQRTPDGPHSVTWLRAAQQVEIAISKSKAEDRE